MDLLQRKIQDLEVDNRKLHAEASKVRINRVADAARCGSEDLLPAVVRSRRKINISVSATFFCSLHVFRLHSNFGPLKMLS